MIIVACLYLSSRFASSRLLEWLNKTGQLSLTLYVAHVLVGMGFLEAIGYMENQSIVFSLCCALVLSSLGVAFSVLWLKYFRSGPLEMAFRNVTR